IRIRDFRKKKGEGWLPIGQGREKERGNSALEREREREIRFWVFCSLLLNDKITPYCRLYNPQNTQLLPT
ncbi:unnamed protein product, partial [Linum tenue]